MMSKNVRLTWMLIVMCLFHAGVDLQTASVAVAPASGIALIPEPNRSGPTQP